MIRTGLDRLLLNPEALSGRRYGLLSHAAARSCDLEPIHLALLRAGAPAPQVLLGPEHGFYGIEQDMVPSGDEGDPWTDIPIVSLYGRSEDSLQLQPEALRGLDLVVLDLQDVGARYYTYAATALWAAAVALSQGCEVWILDRPNPLGGVAVEGNLRGPGCESVVGAFRIPPRHGLTLAELALLEGRRQDWPAGLRVWEMEGWRREMDWWDLERPWVPPSPNIPSPEIALIYPGMCLVEGTELSEGRGTTQPFQLVGAPGIDPTALVEGLTARQLPGVQFVPTYFRPQFHKHRGEVCGGVEVRVTDRGIFRPYRCGVELLAVARQVAPAAFSWRQEAYEFVTDRPAIDLLAGDSALRRILDSGGALDPWIESWAADEEEFRQERNEILLYPEGQA